MHLLKNTEHQWLQVPDREIVRRVLAGERELYELILRRYNQKLYRVVRGYFSDEQEIEEVMQQSYIKAYEKLHQFQWKAEFSTWFIRIGIHQALGLLREKRKITKRFSSLDDQEQNVFQIADVHEMTPENKIIQNDTKHLIEKAVSMLPKKYRITYILKEVEGMNISEISQSLQISESNVKVRIHRSKILLKDILFAMSSKEEIFQFGNTRCDRIVNNVMKVILYK